MNPVLVLLAITYGLANMFFAATIAAEWCSYPVEVKRWHLLFLPGILLFLLAYGVASAIVWISVRSRIPQWLSKPLWRSK